MIPSSLALVLLAAILSGKAAASGTDAAPFAASIGKLNVSGVGSCTAVLVGPSLALTAAHCLYGKRQGRWAQPGSVHLLLGYSRGEYAFHTRASSYVRGGDEVSGV